MNKMTVKVFSVTTAEDQENYFSGEVQIPRRASEGPSQQLASGLYRIIDGRLCQIHVAFSPDEVRHKLDIITKK